MNSLKMDLFEGINEQPVNVIQKDGRVTYYNGILATESANNYLHALLKKIAWKQDEVNIFGKQIITKRKVAWYADKPYQYTYSNSTKQALPWIDELLQLKKIVEKKSGESFNSCLLNLYEDGSQGMAWHSDAEKELKKNGAIGSLSLGAKRKFSFKHKISKQTVSLMLDHGSLLIMKDSIQTHWLHRLPPTKTVNRPRVNLTFRTINDYS